MGVHVFFTRARGRSPVLAGCDYFPPVQFAVHPPQSLRMLISGRVRPDLLASSGVFFLLPLPGIIVASRPFQRLAPSQRCLPIAAM